MININEFVNEHVIKRSKSMFFDDLEKNHGHLTEKTKGKKILVIGGAGSIGTSFIRSILPLEPSELIVVDINENALAELTRDLRATKGMYLPKDYIPYPIDYASPSFKKMFLKRKGFDIVANFAAHKHVRSEKDIYSIEALFQNNVLHAKEFLDLLTEYPPEEYFCVSTDKASNPVNIMGASKRIMEDVIFSYSDVFPVKTARFANVAFSNGSLPAGFISRISKLQPLSAPLDVKRYFVSPEESGQICMLACLLGKNREIFFPKLKEKQMMSFDAIATDLLYEYGYEILKCISDKEAIEKAEDLKKGSRQYPVYYSISDTSGEKMFEEFYTKNEIIDMDRFSSLGVIIKKELPDKKRINRLLCDLNNVFDKEDTEKKDIIAVIKTYLPDFQHIEREKSLDSKM